MIPHKNRIPERAGRINLSPIEGEANKYIMTRADEPLTEGTPINQEVLDEFLAASGITTGTSSALILEQEAYQLGDGYAVRFKVHTDIASNDNPTLNINGTGDKRILSAGGYPFGTIKAGTWVFAIYDAALSAYIITGFYDIINSPVDEIANEDFVPFFDMSGGKSARLLMSEFTKAIARAIDVKHEVARFTATGTWTCPAGVKVVDAWIVGGGGAGGSNGVGGGGGYCRIVRNIPVTPGKSYNIVVGTGGSAGDGGTSSAFDYEAEGGKSGDNGGAGGNFGGAYGNNKYCGRDGGSRGSGSIGLGADWHTTNPYDGIDYAGGGGGAGYVGTSTSQAQYAGGYGGGSFGGKNGVNGSNGGGRTQGNATYCGGGGGSYGGGGGGGYSTTTRGGSGIVIIYAPVITEV